VRPAATAPSPTAKSLSLAPAGTASNFAWSGKKTATLYRVTVPADPVLVHGNRLGGAKGPQPVPVNATRRDVSRRREMPDRGYGRRVRHGRSLEIRSVAISTHSMAFPS